MTAQAAREKQSYYMEQYEAGNVGWPELQTMLQLMWEQIQELEKGETT